MHPDELDGRIKMLTARASELSDIRRDLTDFDDDDGDAGVRVRLAPRHPTNTGGIALPEPDDDPQLTSPILV